LKRIPNAPGRSRPLKRTDTKVRDYVTREEMDAVLASLDRTHWWARR
jgi:hypothetical protein